MLNKCLLKMNKLNYRYFCTECVSFIISHRPLNPYEIAESEEIDIRKIDKYTSVELTKNSSNKNKVEKDALNDSAE